MCWCIRYYSLTIHFADTMEDHLKMTLERAFLHFARELGSTLSYIKWFPLFSYSSCFHHNVCNTSSHHLEEQQMVYTRSAVLGIDLSLADRAPASSYL